MEWPNEAQLTELVAFCVLMAGPDAVLLTAAVIAVIVSCLKLKKPLKGLQRLRSGSLDHRAGHAGDLPQTLRGGGTSLQTMRQACKSVFYTTVNSAAYENYSSDAVPGWLMTAYIIESIVAAGGWVVLVVPLVICMVGLLIASPFGIIFSGGDGSPDAASPVVARKVER